jgi:hypothetical protein
MPAAFCNRRGFSAEKRFRPEYADVAHLVERHLAKVEVASSSLVIRSKNEASALTGAFCFMSASRCLHLFSIRGGVPGKAQLLRGNVASSSLVIRSKKNFYRKIEVFLFSG